MRRGLAPGGVHGADRGRERGKEAGPLRPAGGQPVPPPQQGPRGRQAGRRGSAQPPARRRRCSPAIPGPCSSRAATGLGLGLGLVALAEPRRLCCTRSPPPLPCAVEAVVSPLRPPPDGFMGKEGPRSGGIKCHERINEYILSSYKETVIRKAEQWSLGA